MYVEISLCDGECIDVVIVVLDEWGLVLKVVVVLVLNLLCVYLVLVNVY